MEVELERYLQQYFHYDSFKLGQKEIILDVLEGKDVLGVLPTGSGKSLCYQLTAKLLPGITIVISPLISLMIDQVRQIKAYYYKEVVALHSFQTWHEKRKILKRLHQYKLVFVSPELLQQDHVKNQLNQYHLSLFVIDEAHCISQWGYDFRPDYLRLQVLATTYSNIPVLALTATASPAVQRDIMNTLGREMVTHTYSMERTNISFVIENVLGQEEDKKVKLKDYLFQIKVPTIIYFSSRKTAEELSIYLDEVLPNRAVTYYHAGLENEDRLKVQQQFMNDEVDIVCCTSAFGMGINKPNIRLVIHYHLPTQLESFIQEVGRAGRDGEDSVSVILYRPGDQQVPLSIIENELPTSWEIQYICEQLQHMAIQERRLPNRTKQLEGTFQISEPKWRFILYQLEITGLIYNRYLRKDEERWKHAMEEMDQFCIDRLQLKRKKVQQLMQWIKGSHCLRDSLYLFYQGEIEQTQQHCCSNCGFTLNDIEIKHETYKSHSTQSNWRSNLQSILFPGAKINETSRNH